jgi:hypothetical protein
MNKREFRVLRAAWFGWSIGCLAAIALVFGLWHFRALPPGTWFGLFLTAIFTAIGALSGALLGADNTHD